jgi:hypothetical protein
MSETASLPTLEQVEQAGQKYLSQLGVLDFEYRAVQERIASMSERSNEIESQKEKIISLLQRLENTKKVILEQAKSESQDGAGSEVAGA